MTEVLAISSLCMTLVISAILSRYMTTYCRGNMEAYRQVIYIYSTLFLMIFSLGFQAHLFLLSCTCPGRRAGGDSQIQRVYSGDFFSHSVRRSIMDSWYSGNPLLTDNLIFCKWHLCCWYVCVSGTAWPCTGWHMLAGVRIISRILSVLALFCNSVIFQYRGSQDHNPDWHSLLFRLISRWYAPLDITALKM